MQKEQVRLPKLDGITLAGKTGTAELKVSKEAEGKELGWFAAFRCKCARYDCYNDD